MLLTMSVFLLQAARVIAESPSFRRWAGILIAGKRDVHAGPHRYKSFVKRRH